MKVVKENKFENIFPIKIKCRRVVDAYGFAYGKTNDFCGSELEVEVEDIKKHKWFKYPNYSGTDYGVRCPICNQFIPIKEEDIPKTIKERAEEIYLSV